MAYLRAANEQCPGPHPPRAGSAAAAGTAKAKRGLGSGITAMPSMHVAMAYLFWLGIRRVSRAGRWFFFAFFVAIWIGSVHLAYHYAVDGLVSVIATAILWEASGAILRGLGPARSCAGRTGRAKPRVA